MNSYGSLLNIDVDFFKNLNDSEGHQTGDVCLMKLGGLLKSMCRRKLDLAARYGGEEFAMILPITNSADAASVAESIRRAVMNLRIPHPASPVSTYLTVSIGVATAVEGKFSTPETLIAASDRALYEAKRAGRNRVSVAQDDGEARVRASQ
jgi:diguanylate cyclase (GGDEF)-like protein